MQFEKIFTLFEYIQDPPQNELISSTKWSTLKTYTYVQITSYGQRLYLYI